MEDSYGLDDRWLRPAGHANVRLECLKANGLRMKLELRLRLNDVITFRALKRDASISLFDPIRRLKDSPIARLTLVSSLTSLPGFVFDYVGAS